MINVWQEKLRRVLFLVNMWYICNTIIYGYNNQLT